eukprot:gene10162-18830_t
MHCSRELAFTKSGKQVFKRKYSKRTKRWHAQPVKDVKEYKYIPYLIARMLKRRIKDLEPMTRKFNTLEQDPKELHATI